jgi:hypothetical protein
MSSSFLLKEEIIMFVNMVELVRDALDFIVSFFISIDYYQILYTFLGAFLGFFIPFLVQKKNEKRKKKKIINNIFRELSGIKNNLDVNIIMSLEKMDNDLINQIREKSIIEIYLREDLKTRLIECYDNISEVCLELYVPIWDALVATGDVIEFKDECYFDDMMQVYTHIKVIFNIVSFQLASSLSDEIKREKVLKIIKEVTIIESFLSDSVLNFYI